MIIYITYSAETTDQDDVISEIMGKYPVESGCFLGKLLQRDLEYSISKKKWQEAEPRLKKLKINYKILRG